jgi:FMN reductase
VRHQRHLSCSGNLRRPSRTREPVEHIGSEATRNRSVTFSLYDLIEARPGLGAAFTRDTLSSRAAAIVEAIEAAAALIVGTSVFKASYTGLFKHLFDFVGPATLANRSIVLAATRGGQKHALIVKRRLRPLFGFLTALTISTASDQDFVKYRLVDSAVIDGAADAASQLNVAIDTWLANMRGRTNGADGPGACSYGVAANTSVMHQSSHGGAS